MSDVKNALRKMRIVKLVGPEDIPTKVWKYVGRKEFLWWTKLFNNILKPKECQMCGEKSL